MYNVQHQKPEAIWPLSVDAAAMMSPPVDDAVSSVVTVEQPVSYDSAAKIQATRKTSIKKDDDKDKEVTNSEADSADDQTDGCLTLQTRDGIRYFTRYRIDHVEQTRNLCHIVVYDECIPCCEKEVCRSISSCVWSFIRSEVFIYTVHLTSLFLGAVKAGIETHREAPVLELIDSGFETLATLLVIAIRMGNAYFGYCQVCHMIRHDEKYDPGGEIHVKLIRRWMILFLIAGAALFIFALGFFVLFLFLVSLSWTILTNNFCMMTVQVFAGLYRMLVALAVTRIHSDQDKVVISESILFLRAASSPDDDTTLTTHLNMSTFADAVENTELFARPPYVNLGNVNTTPYDVSIYTI